MEIKKGNSIIWRIEAVDQDGNVITNLSTATAVKYMVKINKTDVDTDAKISKSLGSGIVVDTPTTGTIEVTLTATDTDITPKTYYQALQIEYSADNIQEITLKENDCVINSLTILQDIIE